jgi:hypothetical protein
MIKFCLLFLVRLEGVFLRREVSSKLTGSIYPGHIEVIHKSVGRAKVKLRLALGVNEIKMRLLYMMDGDQHRQN